MFFFNKNNSIQYILLVVVFAIIAFVMSCFILYNYNYTEEKLSKELNKTSKLITKRVALSIAHFMESYQVNEYEKLIEIEIQNKNITAIIVEDYVTGVIIGSRIFEIGKIKTPNGKIKNLKYNKNNSKILKNSYLQTKENVISSDNSTIGKVTIYYSNEYIKKELDKLLLNGILSTICISIILMLLIYFSIKKLFLTPIIELSKKLERIKEDKTLYIPEHKSFKELNILYSSIKDLSNSVKNYNIFVEKKNQELNEAYKEIKDVSNKLELEKTKYQAMLFYASDGVLLIDLNGKLIEYSKRVPKLLKYKEEELSNLSIYDWDKNITPQELQNIISSMNNNKTLEIERVHTRKDNTTYIASIRANKIKINNQQFIYASVRDITKEKELQKLILTQKDEFEKIFNYALDGISITDLEGNFIKFNEAFRQLTGYDEEELLTKNCNELTAIEDKEKNTKAIEIAIEKGHVENFEKSCIMNEDKKVTVHVSISLLPDKKSLLFIVKDASTLKVLEQQSKLASMGEMIGNIAHQWRQPLSMISTSASGLRMQAEYGIKIEQKQLVEFSNLIVQQTKYLSHTIDNFRDFIKGDVKYSNLKIKSVLENTISLVEASLKNNHITIIKDIDCDLEVYGSVNELNEAFINIINNAKDILKEKIKDEDDRVLFISVKYLGEDEVEISFKDTGGGIDEYIIEKIFEPYFTTKHKSLGTGLGLSMSDKIIRERHHGKIEVENQEFTFRSKEYKGACFKVILKVV